MSVPPQRAGWAVGVPTRRRIGGRWWRISDPRIPPRWRQVLVDELMAARRAVRDTDGAARRAARDRVHDAKVALGERGLRWWEADVEPADVVDRVQRTARVLRRAGVEDVPSITAEVCTLPVTAVERMLRPVRR